MNAHTDTPAASYPMLTKELSPPEAAWTATMTAELLSATVEVRDGGWVVTATGHRTGAATPYIDDPRPNYIGRITLEWTQAVHGDNAPAWVLALVSEAKRA